MPDERQTPDQAKIGEILFTSPDFLSFPWSPRPHLGVAINTNDNTDQGHRPTRRGCRGGKRDRGPWRRYARAGARLSPAARSTADSTALI
jgi:hypothetical protein